ncbi:LysM peptidoglycan-binding domain-containing protein [Amycolatopsis sp. H20-H5]|uniref:LysM peptidoglycan-binding domain-containing protein n=1 Tax=Amycolatopsis sp. H20-H5 TaxID=3046309 RepID=UPI002DBF3B11|nr:hypothetical protein [Amycolatopsis sp. H20-H5]MEC3974327.1 hypothetical protein [Amycolatopsis sp. H20-H5]
MTWISQNPARRPVQLVAGLVRALVALTVLFVLVVVLPYGLAHYIGWPLPDHIPTWPELQNVLMAPMSAQFLLNLLACVLWPLWARFTFDVLAAIPDTVRTTGWPRRLSSVRHGPLHAVAGVLVGAILFSLLNSRASTSASSVSITASDTASGHAAVATAHYQPIVDEKTGGEQQPVITTAVHTRAVVRSDERGIEVVRQPEHGVYDSLWRVAQRCLGDGDRWPEIWKLNQGATQTDGRVLTTPSLVRPGWQLQLPAATAAVPPSPPAEDEPSDPPLEQPDLGDQTNPSTPVPAQPSPPVQPVSAAEPGTGITLSTGAFVGLGLAALITVAMVTARLHRRRRYQPGTPEPHDPSTAPVVRALRIAHDSATLPDDDGSDLQLPAETTRPADLATRDRARATARQVLDEQKETVLGVRDGHAVALDLAHERGLGFIGPGAYAAARALIVTQLAQAAENDLHALVVLPTDVAQPCSARTFHIESRPGSESWRTCRRHLTLSKSNSSPASVTTT